MARTTKGKGGRSAARSTETPPAEDVPIAETAGPEPDVEAPPAEDVPFEETAGPEPDVEADALQASSTEEDVDPLKDLPWLNAVDDDDPSLRKSQSMFRQVIPAILGILLIGLVGYYLITLTLPREDPGEAQPELASLDETTDTSPYQNLNVAEDAKQATQPKPSEKAKASQKVKAPEKIAAKAQPSKQPQKALQQAAAPARLSTPATRVASRATPEPVATAGRPTIQLASYFSERRAEEYWDSLVRKHKRLTRLKHEVVQGSVNGKTVHRLRASGDKAHELCEGLVSRGVPCLRIGRG